jgi:hypothetical protein
MNASSSIAVLIAACGLLATAPSRGDDAHSAPASGGDSASAVSPAAGGTSATESRRDASGRAAAESKVSNDTTPPGGIASGASGRQAEPAAQAATASAGGAASDASSNDSKAKADPLAASVIDEGQLGKARGGAELQPVNLNVNQNNSTGSVSGNVASNLTTGSNGISDSAFSNASGVPVVIQNTGNNVLIQNSTILNLQLSAPSASK